MNLNQLLTKEDDQSQSTDGFSLIEALLAVSLFALFSLGFAGAYFYGQESSVLAGERARATLIAEEGLEAVRNIRADDFSNLEDGTYGLEINGGQWDLSDSSDAQDIFIREIEISTVGDNRKQVDAVVTWEQTTQRDGEIVLSTHMTNWQEVQSGPADCTGPPDQRPSECDNGSGGGPSGDDGGGPPSGASTPGGS